MQIYQINADSDLYPSYAYYGENYRDLIDQAEEGVLSHGIASLILERIVPGKNLKNADFAGVHIYGYFFACSDRVVNELFPIQGVTIETFDTKVDDGSEVAVWFNMPWVAPFPEGATIPYRNRDIVVAVNESVVAEYPVFRGSVYGTHGRVPSGYRYATQVFKDRYDELGLTGLIFEPIFPLEDRLDFIVEQETQKKLAIAKAEMRYAQSKKAKKSSLPTGEVPEAEITWREGKQPTPEQLARFLWQSVIDAYMDGRWISNITAADVPDAPAVTHLAAQALDLLLDKGVDANALNHLARAIAMHSVGETLLTLESLDFVRAKNAKFDWQDIVIQLTQSATRDAEGRIGGWPPAKGR